jgi:hypothetical protein
VTQSLLFERGPKVPEGLLFEPDFLTMAEENELIDAIRTLPTTPCMRTSPKRVCGAIADGVEVAGNFRGGAELM